MIDLSNAEVGDKYIDYYGYEVTVALIAKEEICFTLPDLSGFVVCDLNGANTDGDQVVLSKIDKRPWLKDMPDAGIFSVGQWLACDSDFTWRIHGSESKVDGECFDSPHDYHDYIVLGASMPTLTGDQWKDSLISIEELREWQEVNK